MFRAKSNLYPPCKKHPKHKQSPGVCSLCLNEKLSHLSSRTAASSSGRRPRVSSSSSSSSLSSLSSSDISSCVSSRVSPMRAIQRRVASEARASEYSFSRNLLGKNDSTAVFRTRPIDQTEGDHHGNIHSMKGKEKKGGGFWSNLLTSQPRRTRNITNHHLSRVIDQRAFIYSQPLTS